MTKEEINDYVKRIDALSEEDVAYMTDLLDNSDNLYIYSHDKGAIIIGTDEDNDVYGTLPHKKNGFGDTIYYVNKENIQNGLKSAIMGTFKTGTTQPEDAQRVIDNASTAVVHLFNDLDEDDTMFDGGDVDMLFQIICFNEIIYG